jgi:hypothetical protein
MVSTIIIVFLAVVVALLVALLVSALWGRGQPITCPECKFKFKRPLPEKAGGLGFSFRGVGSYTCPHCKYRGRTSKFERAADLNNTE